MVSYNNDELLMLGGWKEESHLCDITAFSTANDSPNASLKPRTIVEKNAAGHIKFGFHGNQAAKVAKGHVIIFGTDHDDNSKLLEFKASTGRVDIFK